ncbi:proteasome-type protease [Planctomycetes bacterium K23_9]|uniref:Proteasome subunit n=1 Tax=Stieleria marina TaxID=1930275 RepID=A0A517NVV7_9BACT|nr:Proteasome subunit [Planctomycetes bacterium K23_9]
MTFCIGIKVREGIVALADTRIVKGSEQSNKQKLAGLQHAGDVVFTMTSGLRSVRDKTVIYLDETLRQIEQPVSRLYQVANLFGEELRRVKTEDGPSLAATGHAFNLHAIIGGRLPDDAEPQLFYVYPEGNWVEAAVDLPYFIIGRTPYGKPVLDRLLTYETPLKEALTLALLAFDATRSSVTDVDCPVDVAVMTAASSEPIFRRFTEQELHSALEWWSQSMASALKATPMDWAESLFPVQ